MSSRPKPYPETAKCTTCGDTARVRGRSDHDWQFEHAETRHPEQREVTFDLYAPDPDRHKRRG